MTKLVEPFAFGREFQPANSDRRSRDELEAEVRRLRREVERARAAGRDEGQAEALAALQAERDTALLAATQALVAALATIAQKFEATEQAVARLGADLALDLADHLAARALARDPALPVDEALGRVLRQVRRGQPLLVRVSPEVVDGLQQLIDQRQAGERRRLSVTLLGDPAIVPGDARIEWDGGALVLDAAARRTAMAEEIAALLAA